MSTTSRIFGKKLGVEGNLGLEKEAGLRSKRGDVPRVVERSGTQSNNELRMFVGKERRRGDAKVAHEVLVLGHGFGPVTSEMREIENDAIKCPT